VRLASPRPLDKSLGDPFAGTSAAEKLGEGASGEAVRWDRGEQSEHGQTLSEVDVWDLMSETKMPARCRPLELLRLTIG
jgi:hypothetical protein